jgi:hypothetical protein
MEDQNQAINLPPSVRISKWRRKSSPKKKSSDPAVGQRLRGWVGFYNADQEWGFICSGTPTQHSTYFFCRDNFAAGEEAKSFRLSTALEFTVGPRILTHSKNYTALDIKILEGQEQ